MHVGSLECLRRIREQLLLLQCSRNSIIAEWRIGNPLNGFLSFFFFFFHFFIFFATIIFFLLEEQKHFIASCYLIACTVMITHFLYSGIDRALWEETKEKQTEHYVYLWKVKTWWSHYERMVAHRNGFLSFLIFFIFFVSILVFPWRKTKTFRTRTRFWNGSYAFPFGLNEYLTLEKLFDFADPKRINLLWIWCLLVRELSILYFYFHYLSVWRTLIYIDDHHLS